MYSTLSYRFHLARPAGAVHPKTSPGLSGLACGIVAGLSRSLSAFAAAGTAIRNCICS